MKLSYLSFIMCFLVGCSSSEKWIKTEEFENIPVYFIKGNHVLVAIADKPVRCAIYRQGNIVIETESSTERNECALKFPTEDENLSFFISLKGDRGNFKFRWTRM